MKKAAKKLVLAALTAGMLTTAPVFSSGLGLSTQAQAAVKINKKNVTLLVGKTQKLKVKGTKKKVTWKSSKKSVATVNAKGVVKALKAGTTTITAKVGKKKYKCKVNVRITSLGASSVNIVGRQTKKVVFTFIKDGYFYYDVEDASIASCDWQKSWWGGNNKTYLYITGKKNGTTVVTLTNSVNKESLKLLVHVSGIGSSSASEEAEDSVQAAYDKLSEYIVDRGSRTPDGYGWQISYSTPGDSSITYDIRYIPGTSLFQFVTRQDGEDRMAVSVEYDHYRRADAVYMNAGYTAKAIFDPQTLSSSPNLAFAVEPDDIMASAMKKLANNLLGSTITIMDLGPLSGTGITMKQLGFTRY